MKAEIAELLFKLKKEIEKIEDVDEKIDTLNEIKINLHEVSPITDPVDCVIWVPANTVQANDYNPNKVASPEMKLLYQSIKLDGYTMPVVTYNLETGNREVVDGFHRNRIVKEHNDIAERTFGRLPVSTIDKLLDERMGSTIRHNRARGTHQIRSMSDIVLELTKYGWSDQEICKKLGMELDEVIRLKQITGLKEAFANHEFSKSWEKYEQRRKEFYAET
jgi:ParB-like chromosome segregation protein Spo0J